MRHVRTALVLAVIGLSGCGKNSASSTSPPLGRPLHAELAPLSPAPVSSGDPPKERGGTIPPGQAATTYSRSTTSGAPSPQVALRSYALMYTNWQASSLPAHERALASLAVGAARLAAEQTAASQSGAATLEADRVQNKGVVLVIARGQGPARGKWVVVTQEQTTGIGPYAGLPSLPHVTLARTARLGGGWAVSEWSPKR